MLKRSPCLAEERCLRLQWTAAKRPSTSAEQQLLLTVLPRGLAAPRAGPAEASARLLISPAQPTGGLLSANWNSGCQKRPLPHTGTTARSTHHAQTKQKSQSIFHQ